MAKIVPVVQLAAHAISSTLYSRSFGLRLYGRKSKFFRFDRLLLFCTSAASSSIIIIR